jgi:hypothetical protein
MGSFWEQLDEKEKMLRKNDALCRLKAPRRGCFPQLKHPPKVELRGGGGASQVKRPLNGPY